MTKSISNGVKKILIVKNCIRKGPGIIKETLDWENIPYHLVDLDKGHRFPLPKGYSAVVVLGGGDSANDETQKMRLELQRIKECLEYGIPYLGICLGMQALVKAAGADVIKNPIKEIGFRDEEGALFTVEFTDVGKKDALFKEVGSSFPVFQLHGETVEFNEGGDIQVLGTGKLCKYQAVKVGDKAYGLQFHIELTNELLGQLLSQDPWFLEKDQASLEADFKALFKDYTKTGRQIIHNFLNLLN